MFENTGIHPQALISRSNPIICRAFAHGVSDHQKCAFDISPFHFFELFSKHLQSKPIQTAIFEQFFEARAMDTSSSNNSSSSYWFLFELCAREAASLGAIGHGDSPWFSTRVSPFFEAISGTVFFWKMVPNGISNDLRNVTKSDKKRHLKRSPQNMLKMC